ncbi:MAG: serine hydrolase [Patescibacteria group bacterium]|nr:serine hydrolase [Patescibacteria group bacterium]
MQFIDLANKPRKSTKFYLAIIILLLIGIAIVFFRQISINSKKNITGQVKSAQTEQTNVSIDVDPYKLTMPPQNKNSSRPLIYAKNYILMDVDSFYPLAEKESHTAVPVASTTKIMTAIIVLENYNLSDVVTISQNAAGQIGDDVTLRTDEKITVENLLYALILRSGNDAAMALAEFYKDGGKEGFIRKMNEKAQFLGMKDTNFMDPAGLDDNGKSSAFDLALAASYAMKNKRFSELTNTSQKTVTSIDGKFSHDLTTSNRLVKPDESFYSPFANGVKTGYTPDAGHCLVSSAIKDNHQLIGVILNTYESTIIASAKESKKLLDWGFDNFQWN